VHEWADAGVFDQLHRAVLDPLGEQGRLDWSRASRDSVSVRARRGALTGPNPTDRGIFRRALNGLGVTTAAALMVRDHSRPDTAAVEHGVTTPLLPPLQQVTEHRPSMVLAVCDLMLCDTRWAVHRTGPAQTAGSRGRPTPRLRVEHVGLTAAPGLVDSRSST
jgi:hypothetical protein